MLRKLTIAVLAAGMTLSSCLWAQARPADARTGPFFKYANRERLVTQLTEQLCQASGGPCSYEGAPMGPVHASMNIGKGDFNALVAVLPQSMDAKGIPFAAQNGMLARLAPMHQEIVTRD